MFGNNDLAHLDSAYTPPRTVSSFCSRVTSSKFEKLMTVKTSYPELKISSCAKCSKLLSSALTQVNPIFLLQAAWQEGEIHMQE